MMRKLVLGLAVCWCVTASGMEVETVGEIVSCLAQNPDNRQKLTELVQKLVDERSGKENTDQAIDALSMISAKNRQNEMFEKIGCMLWALSYHWAAGYRLVHNEQYYVDGALVGSFGPYDF